MLLIMQVILQAIVVFSFSSIRIKAIQVLLSALYDCFIHISFCVDIIVFEFLSNLRVCMVLLYLSRVILIQTFFTIFNKKILSLVLIQCLEIFKVKNRVLTRGRKVHEDILFARAHHLFKQIFETQVFQRDWSDFNIFLHQVLFVISRVICVENHLIF